MPSAYFATILRGQGRTPGLADALLAGTGLSEANLRASDDITLGQQLQQIRNAVAQLEPGWSLANLEETRRRIVANVNVELRTNALPRSLSRRLEVLRYALFNSGLPKLLIRQGLWRLL